METIKNCRRCKKPGRIKDTYNKFRRGWVGCPACRIYFHWVHDPRDAVKKWNEWNTDTSSVACGDSFPSRGSREEAGA